MKATPRVLVAAVLLIAGAALGAGLLTKRSSSSTAAADRVSAPAPAVVAPSAAPAPPMIDPALLPASSEAIPLSKPAAPAKAKKPAAPSAAPVREIAEPSVESDGPAAAALASRFGGGRGDEERQYTKEELAALMKANVASDPVVPVLSPPLRDVPPSASMMDPFTEDDDRHLPTKHNRAVSAPTGPDGALQLSPGPSLLSPTGVNFDGLPANGFAPPDNNGRVGPNHYIQWINVNFAIYDKSGTLLYGPAAGNSLFTALGASSPCVRTNDGDPLVVYDALADRWVLTQFVVQDGPTLDSYQCTAVSVTGDPLGSYYLYAFKLGTNQFWDYPHHSTWTDAYYSTFHVFNGAGTAFLFQGLAAFERPAMLAGLPARVVPTPMDNTMTYFGALPADIDGLTPPPATTAEMIFAPGTNEWDGTTPPTAATLHVWTATTTWGATPVTTLSGPTDMTGINLYNTDLCDFSRQCINQPPPTAAADRVDALPGRMMNRVAYRNFGAYESIVLSDGVNTNPFTSPQTLNNAAPRWYEIRRPGGVPTVFQQGTYAPDSDHRWTPSIAMDNSGNIALGYSKSSTVTKPEIDVVGRLAGDPLGTLGTEMVMQAGVGVQIGTGNRWGDYSAMTVDPRDGCTFWYTNQYQPANGSFNWKTRIGAFRFAPAECSPPAKGTLTGTVKDGGGTPISGALVSLDNGFSGSTNAAGIYTIVLPPGAANATASAALRTGCNPSASSGVVITNGAVTTKNFALAGTASMALGTVTIDDSGGNNNGIINKDECVKVILPLSNLGCATATGISGVLSTVTPGVTVTQPNASYADTSPGQSVSGSAPLQIATAPGFVCGTPIALTFTVTSSAGVQPLNFSLPTCQLTISQNGSIAAGDPQQTGRLSRGGVSTTCATGHATPPLIDSVLRRYDQYTFTNGHGTPVCVTAQVTSGCGTNLFYVTYDTSFNPANIQQNYMADPGSSFAGTATWSFNVAAGQTFVIVVHEVATTGCASYNLTVTGLFDESDGGRPAAPTAGNNGPVCAGSTVNLTASAIGGATYHWTGPNGFVSNVQNPSIPSATVAASGTYTVVATVGTCASDPATTNVTVNPNPSATISAPAQVCAESTTNVASVPDAGPGASYVWTITNGTITGGAGTNSITFTANATNQPISLGVTVQTAAGCIAVGNFSVNVSATCGNFFTLTPCRLIDTRTPAQVPALAGGGTRTFIIAGNCGVPATAQAIAANQAVVNATGGGNLQIYPGGGAAPQSSTINYNAGQIRANNAIITLGPGGTITIKCNQTGTVDLVLDVNGYFE